VKIAVAGMANDWRRALFQIYVQARKIKAIVFSTPLNLD
jgi:hypothetical protein